MTGDQLDQAGIESMSDLSYSVPSMTTLEVSPGRQSVTLRGVGNARGSSSLIGLYLDEGAVAGPPEEQMDLRAIDLARVEVLRGPQGTLYGEGSTGGTIRYITNDPTLENFSGDVDFSLYDTDKGGFSQEVRAVVDLPVVENVFGLRIAGTYENRAGWVDQPAASREDINDNELSHIRVKALWHASDALNIKGTVLVHRNDIGGSAYVNSGSNEDSNYASPVHPTAESPAVDDYEFYNLTAAYDLGFATLLSASSYANMEKSWVYGFFFPAFSFDVLSQFNQDTKIFTQELRLSSSDEGDLQWTAGLFYRDYENEELTVGDFSVGGTIFPGASFISFIETSKSAAIFGDMSYAFNDRLEMGFGVRYFEDDRDFSDFVSGIPLDGSFDAVSPRVYAAYAFSDNVNLYLNIGKGFRSGGFNTADSIAIGGPETFDAEELWSYEIGSKMVLLDGRVSAEIALYQSDYTDMISVGVLGSGIGSTSNIGEAEIKGIDLSFVWTPHEQLTLTFNGNVVDAEVVAVNATGTPQIVGDSLDTVAEYGYSLTTDYSFNWNDATAGFFRISYQEQGESEFTLRGSGLANPVLKSDKLTFLSANIGVEFANWTGELFGKNLLNDAGWTTPYGPEFGTSPQARPRTLGIKFGTEF